MSENQPTNVQPWHEIGDVMQLGGTVLVKKAGKVEQLPPKK